MFAFPSFSRMKGATLGLPGLTLVAAAAGVALGTIVALLPATTLGVAIEATGLPQLWHPATPPLGDTARLLLAAGTAVASAAVIWALLVLIVGPGTTPVREPGVPVLRRADAHPDAPARRPIMASEDLEPAGVPLARAAAEPVPETRIIDRALPQDLDQPLAAFDPHAIPDVPLTPVPPVAPLTPRPQLIDPGERFETFELTPVIRRGPDAEPAAPTPMVPPAAPPTLASLIERLERGAQRREPPRGIDDTLGMLRRLAAG